MPVPTTPNIGLKMPDLSELAKNWATNTDIVESNNIQIIDKMDINIQTYTPTLFGSITSPSIGAGSITANFIDFQGMIFGNFQIIFTDPGVAAGAGSYGISLPYGLDSTYHAVTSNLTFSPGQYSCLGEAYFYNASNAVAGSGSCALDGAVITGTSYLRLIFDTFIGKTNSVWNNSNPEPVANNDAVNGHFIYKKA